MHCKIVISSLLLVSLTACAPKPAPITCDPILDKYGVEIVASGCPAVADSADQTSTPDDGSDDDSAGGLGGSINRPPDGREQGETE